MSVSNYPIPNPRISLISATMPGTDPGFQKKGGGGGGGGGRPGVTYENWGTGVVFSELV